MKKIYPFLAILSLSCRTPAESQMKESTEFISFCARRAANCRSKKDIITYNKARLTMTCKDKLSDLIFVAEWMDNKKIGNAFSFYGRVSTSNDHIIREHLISVWKAKEEDKSSVRIESTLIKPDKREETSLDCKPCKTECCLKEGKMFYCHYLNDGMQYHYWLKEPKITEPAEEFISAMEQYRKK